MSVPSLQPAYRVVVIEWLSHTAVIEAESRQHAEEEARRLWAENAEHEIFAFSDGGLDGVMVEEILRKRRRDFQPRDRRRSAAP
jgi:hypothetical protein